MFPSGFTHLGLGDFYCLFEDDPANDRVAMWRGQGSVVGEEFTRKKKSIIYRFENGMGGFHDNCWGYIIVESGSCGSIFQRYNNFSPEYG